MSRKQLILIALVCMSAVILMPQEMMASTDGDLFKGVAVQADKIKDFLFGTAMRFTGALGAFYGAIRSIFSNSMTPFLTFGGIGLGVVLMPKFLDGVYGVSGMLIQ